MAIYVYGVMRPADATRAVKARASLQAVEHGEVSALVSGVGEGDLTLRRESALAHTDTLQEAFEHGPVLPMRFGTIVADEGALRSEVLAPRASTLRSRLDALEGLAEMQVKATYLEEPLLRSILSSDAGLSRVAARIRELPPAATHFERIGLGESISQHVQARRMADSQRMIQDLRPLSVATSIREPRHERAVLNGSFLVARERLAEFDARVQRLSEEGAGRLSFKLIGPMPAHSFADSDLEPDPVTGSSAWG